MGCCSSNAKATKHTIRKKSLHDSIILKGDVQDIHRKYKITKKVLGSGQFGKVFLAQMHLNPDVRVAIKTMQKNKVGNSVDYINQEIGILRRLDHPNIVRYYEAFESDKHIYLVMEYCEGEELFTRLSQEESSITENDARTLMKNLL